MNIFRLLARHPRSVSFHYLLAIGISLSITSQLAGCSSESVPTAVRPSGTPNVVWILIDTLRADHLHCYGYERETSPNIDKLALEGALFEQNYAQGPNTVLSVPTYMTGKYFPAFYQDPFFLGIWLLRSPAEDEKTISTIFNDNGYSTGMFSASPWFTKDSRLAKSFDTFDTLSKSYELENGDFRNANPSLFTWMNDHIEKPFFLYVHTLDAHEPRGEHNTFKTWVDESFPEQRDRELRNWSGSPFNNADISHIRDLYDGGVAYADYTVGEIVSHLEKLGIRDNTLIIISSDHGEVLAEDGVTLGHPGHQYFDDLLHVPLILSGTGIPKNKRISTRTQNIDIVATLVDWLKLDTNSTNDGTTLVPLLSEINPSPIHPIIYSKAQNKHVTLEPKHILITDDAKYEYPGIFEDDKTTPKSPLQIQQELNVWAYPDYAHIRVPYSTPQSAENKHIESFLRNTIIPKWRLHEAQPLVTPTYFKFPHWELLLKDMISDEGNPKDGKWTKVSEEMNFMVSPNIFYVAHNATETVPEMDLMRSIPNGVYDVKILTKTWPVDGVQQQCSFKIRTGPSEDDFIPIILSPGADNQPAQKWFDIGSITILNEKIYYVIAPLNKEDVSVIGGLSFSITGIEVDENEINRMIQKENEALEALGYLN